MESSLAEAERSRPLILVVDDDRMMREILRDALADGGFEVVAAASGDEGIARFRELRPSLMILDVEMPGTSGFDACREIRRVYPEDPTPIVMLTGTHDRAAIEEAYQAGATDFISKPLNADLLAHRVRYMLRSRGAVEDLRRSQDLLQRSQRLAKLGSWEWSPDTDEVVWSEETFRLLGLLPGSAVADYDLFFERVHPEDRERVESELEKARLSDKPFSFEHRLLLDGGRVVHVHQHVERGPAGPAEELRVIGTVQDVTDQALAKAKIRQLANYDDLTGLPNRRLFRKQLERAIRVAGGRGHQVGLLFMDLDNFKLVNDTLGHSTGDELLRTVAERFSLQVRGSDVVSRMQPSPDAPEVSRLGGDEFTVLLSKISEPTDARDVARRVLKASREPIIVDGQELKVGVSVGIAIYPQDGKDAETLMRNADAAMYQAKELGRGSVEFFSAEMNADALRNLALESRLREALGREELRLHYQPKIGLRDGRLRGFEALLRWHHPELGVVRPTEFIPLTEKTGLIVPLGEWVLRTACSQARAWEQGGFGRARVSVNVSTLQFQRVDMVELVGRTLADTGLAPEDLELELTEGLLIEDAEAVVGIFHAMREMGVRIALDDFGTGFSSLNYLRSLPLDVIKIDRCFVKDLPSEPRAAAIVKGVVELAHGFGLEVVAEGVEDDEQAAFLRDAGCDDAQGFLFHAALQPSDCERLLAASEQTAGPSGDDDR